MRIPNRTRTLSEDLSARCPLWLQTLKGWLAVLVKGIDEQLPPHVCRPHIRQSAKRDVNPKVDSDLPSKP